MSDTAVRIHFLPAPGTVVMKCAMCGCPMATVKYANRGCFRYIRTNYRGEMLVLSEQRTFVRRVVCPQCDSPAEEPDFSEFIAK